MTQDENLHELLRRWTPVTLINLPEEIKSPDIYPDYMGKEKKPLPIGQEIGLLTVVGYSHDVNKPYVFKCACGNLIKANGSSASRVSHCGCFSQITRTAYLIRLRVEALRSWCQQMNAWLDDLNALREHANKYKAKYTQHKQSMAPSLQRIEYADDPLTFDRKISREKITDYDVFMKLIAPSPEYEKFLRGVADKLANVYEPWSAIPMASLSAYASYKRELPEFDSATFINFVNYLIDIKNKPCKCTSDDE